MGSTESSRRSNRTEEEEERQPENSSSGGGSMGAGKAVAIAAAGTVMAAWGISRMISSSSSLENKEKDDAVAIAAVITVMAAWGIYRIISSLENKEKDDAVKIKAHGTESSFQYESKGPTTMWSPPPEGGFKMNTDAICYGTKQSDGVERGPSGFAGILRNHRGEWVRGFQGFIGLTDSFPAEVYGIYYGLKLLDKPEYRGSILETDHHGASVLLNEPVEYVDKRWIVEESRRMAREYHITIKYVPRSGNRCADRLAKMAVDKRQEYLELEKRPKDSELEGRYNQDLEPFK